VALLTEREREVLQLVASGKTNKEIGDLLFISHKTVRTHCQNIYNKMAIPCEKQQVARIKASILGLQQGLYEVSMLNVY